MRPVWRGRDSRGRTAPPRRRQRHGRGLRGPLAPADVPLSATRAELFDDAVLDAVEGLPGYADQLAAVEIAVEEVPPDDPATERVRLGRAEAAGRNRPARLVVYRRPVELRAPRGPERAALLHAVVVELVADLLGLAPEQVDPGWDSSD